MLAFMGWNEGGLCLYWPISVRSMVGPRDVLLGVIDGCPFYVGPAQFEYWAYCQLMVDVTEAGGDSFSLEAADGVRFIVRSRLFTDEEIKELEAAGPPSRGPLNDSSIGSHTTAVAA